VSVTAHRAPSPAAAHERASEPEDTAAAAPRAVRPVVEELRLRAFKSYRGEVLPLAPVTVLHGPSGTGKSNALDALAALSALAGGSEIVTALDGQGNGGAIPAVRGGLLGCIPYGRRSFLLGCTVGTPEGPVSLDVAVRVDGPVRITKERLCCGDEVLMETGEEDPARSRINVSWYSGGRQGYIRAPLTSEKMISAQLPLRVAGATPGEHRVLAAAEHVLTALREVFPIDPVPQLMRMPVPARDDARLRSSAANISAVLARIEGECRIRFGRLVGAMRAVSPHPVTELSVVRGRIDAKGTEGVLAVLQEGELGRTTADRLGSGALRFLAIATVLLTGPGVLQMAPALEVPDARRLLTVLADNLAAGLTGAQAAELLTLAGEVTRRGHVRLLASVQEDTAVRGLADVLAIGCRRDPATGRSVLSLGAAAEQEQDAVDLQA
jgi:hypothetical protein